MGRPGGATPEELLGLVFTGRGRDPEFSSRFLSSLLGEDARFRYEADRGRWRATVHDVLTQSLDDVPFVVFDLETTGERPAPDTITEIGAVRLERGRVTGTFSTLVRPGRRIQPFVVRLTGITDEMVARAPRIADAIGRFRSFIGDAVLVAHNAAFDLNHLEAAHEHHTGARMGRPFLCTIKLARRLMPELRRRSLDTVAAALGIACFDRHRALPDARITADVFSVFLERVREQGIDRIDALLDFQHRAADGEPFVVHVPRQRLDDVPVVPGVYHLLGADGRLLYVGKARRLRERLSSYFANARGHSRKTLDLIRHVYDFRIQETGSELAASLLEARQIRELKPPYNRQRRHLPRVGFVKLSVENGFPRLWVTQRLAADRAVHVGPFPGREAAERAQAVLARTFGLRTCTGSLAPSPDVAPCVLGQIGSCPAPCAARVDQAWYRRRVDACLAFLEGRDEEPIARLTAERETLAAALRFEAAARAQRDLDQLDVIRRRQRTLAWVVTRQNFAVLLPGMNDGAAQLYVVLGGRVALEAHVTASADLVAVTRFVRERYERYQAAPLDREDVEGATILAAWLRDRGKDGIILPLDAADALERRLDELVVTLDDLRQRGPLPAIDGLGVSARRLIVSGDDFGAAPEVNAGIICAHRDGILTSTSLMVTGDAVSEAVALAHANPRLSVGLHLVLAQARPAASPDEIARLLGPDGAFRDNPVMNGLRYAWASCSQTGRAQLRREIEAQLEAFAATGLRLAHVDGHLNMHLHPMVLPLLLELAPRFGIRAMRLTREAIGPALQYDRSHLLRKVSEGCVFAALSAWATPRLRAAGIASADRIFGLHQTGHLDARYLTSLIPALPDGTSEVYCHPAAGTPAVLRRYQPGYDHSGELSALTDPRVRAALDSAGVTLVSYRDL